MAQITNFNLGGLDLYTNPLIHTYSNLAMQEDGQLFRAVNVDSNPTGAKQKRAGYVALLGTPDTGTVASLFSWIPNSGTQLFLYRASGSLLYYSTQGTGAWTICGNGTITPGSYVGNAVVTNVLNISQNSGTTRNTTNGTSFSDTSGAPAGEALAEYQNRLFIAGTSGTVVYSTFSDATNFSIGGTSDSSSFGVTGAGRITKMFKLADRLMITKNYRQIFRWDGYSLVDLAVNTGPTSPYSYGSVEGSGIWLSSLGVYMSNGADVQLISNPIRRFIYNEVGSGILGTNLATAPATVYRHDWYCAVGSTTDDLTNETVPNAIFKYNTVKNEFLNYSYNDFPTAMHTYQDTSGSPVMLFGNNTGQVFQVTGTATSDNGQPIEAIIEVFYNFNVPQLQKDWKWIELFFNPGCEALVEYAASDSFQKENLIWEPMGQAKEGRLFYQFNPQIRSCFLYLKIIESSRNTRFNYYGCAIDADIIPFL